MNRPVKLLAALALTTALSSPAMAQYAAVATWGGVDGYDRANLISVGSQSSGFFEWHGTTFPGGQPPALPYTNLNGAPLQMQTFYSNDQRTFSIGEVLIDNNPATCGCASIPVFAVYLQMAPAGQGFNPFNSFHGSYASYYFCCTYGDGNARRILAQWDNDRGTAALSINGQPWIAAFNSQQVGLPFKVGIGNDAQWALIDSDIVQYWPGFPQAATNIIGATAGMHMVVWGRDQAPFSALQVEGTTATFGHNYAGTGAFDEFGVVDDYIVFGP